MRDCVKMTAHYVFS